MDLHSRRFGPSRLSRQPGHTVEIKTDLDRGQAIVQRIDVNAWGVTRILHTFIRGASAGSTLTLTTTGSGFRGIQRVEFVLAGAGMVGGMMGGGSSSRVGRVDSNIKVSNIQANSAGTQITASVQVLPAAVIGARQVRLQTSNGTVMGMMTNSPFNVTK